MNLFMKYIFYNIAVVFSLLLFLSSCITRKDKLYLQEEGRNKAYKSVPFKQYRLSVNDEINYYLLSTSQETQSLFNSMIPYRIYEDGCVVLPSIGRVRIAGLTTGEAEKVITNRFKSIVLDAEVKIALANNYFYIQGEGGNGQFYLYKEDLNVFQALAMAGDITSIGDKKHIKIIRKGSDGIDHIETFDLRKDRRDEASAKYGVKTVGDVNEVDFSTVKAVIVSLPPDKHFQGAKIAIDNDKAVFVEASVLSKTVNEVEFKLANSIKITVSGKDYVIEPTKQDKLKWITMDYKNNKVNVEKKAITSYLENINQNFEKKGGSTKTVYRISNGTSTLVSKGKSVTGVDEYALTAKIYDAMENNYALTETVKAVSISKPKVAYEGHNSIDNHLVEINIKKQKLYFYENGKVVLTADVVTGQPDGNRNTPTGNFTIAYKTTHFTMRGDDYGYDYELPVDYWMPFEGGGGTGLHDAPWRRPGTFGGSYYLSDGSHGCVNMKLSDVSYIYNRVVAGTGVWIH